MAQGCDRHDIFVPVSELLLQHDADPSDLGSLFNPVVKSQEIKNVSRTQ